MIIWLILCGIAAALGLTAALYDSWWIYFAALATGIVALIWGITHDLGGRHE